MLCKREHFGTFFWMRISYTWSDKILQTRNVNHFFISYFLLFKKGRNQQLSSFIETWSHDCFHIPCFEDSLNLLNLYICEQQTWMPTLNLTNSLLQLITMVKTQRRISTLHLVHECYLRSRVDSNDILAWFEEMVWTFRCQQIMDFAYGSTTGSALSGSVPNQEGWDNRKSWLYFFKRQTSFSSSGCRALVQARAF